MSKKQFKAESKRLLDLMINSIYTHKEIFLRELISNSSDAIDKMNYKSLTETDCKLSKKDFRIDVKTNEKERTITVSDNGIGMTADELENNLGVIAHSGSLDFKENLNDKDKSNIIGQFGVGFYSAFMVGDKITVFTKPYRSDKAFKWESSGVDGYSISECEKDSFGTDVVIHVKDGKDYSEYLDEYRLQSLIKTYSDYIHWPIHMTLESGELKETGEKDENGNPKKEWVRKTEDTVVNSMIPVWQKRKSDSTDEECNEFYKNKFHDFENPLSVIRANAEGAVSYKAMLFIPSRAPFDFYSRDFQPGLQLYCNGVMIMDKCAEILPFSFRFVRGVVESPDFSLNISREVLQHDKQLKTVSSNVTKKIKNELKRMMKDEPEKYLTFYKSFGRQLKFGIVEEYGNNVDLLKDLLMFHSAKENKLISFEEYVSKMDPKQEKIYYVSSDTVEHAASMPQTEPVLEKGFDVLCLCEEVDEFVMKTIAEIDKKPLCDITTEELGLETEEEKKKHEEKSQESKELLEFVKNTLGDKVVSVKISSKLKNHAVMLSSEGHITIEMEKYLRSLPDFDENNKAHLVLELNAEHESFKALKKAYEKDKSKAEKMAKVMFYQAKLVAGLPIDNPVEYSDLVLGLF